MMDRRSFRHGVGSARRLRRTGGPGTGPQGEIKEQGMECTQEKNRQGCNCTYQPCHRKGICCQCLAYHLRNRELPACAFPDAAEKSYDRSFAHFARLVQAGRI
jgi:hypothetical protein